MILSALKPSFGKLGATALIILKTIIYGTLNTAFTKKTSKQMREAFPGEPLATKTKQISENFSCERDAKIADLSTELAEKNPKKCCLFEINELQQIFSYFFSAPTFPRA
ncbi:hypothetical protein [Aquipseudomonas campi]